MDIFSHEFLLAFPSQLSDTGIRGYDICDVLETLHQLHISDTSCNNNLNGDSTVLLEDTTIDNLSSAFTNGISFQDMTKLSDNLSPIHINPLDVTNRYLGNVTIDMSQNAQSSPSLLLEPSESQKSDNENFYQNLEDLSSNSNEFTILNSVIKELKPLALASRPSFMIEQQAIIENLEDNTDYSEYETTLSVSLGDRLLADSKIDVINNFFQSACINENYEEPAVAYEEETNYVSECSKSIDLAMSLVNVTSLSEKTSVKSNQKRYNLKTLRFDIKDNNSMSDTSMKSDSCISLISSPHRSDTEIRILDWFKNSTRSCPIIVSSNITRNDCIKAILHIVSNSNSKVMMPLRDVTKFHSKSNSNVTSNRLSGGNLLIVTSKTQVEFWASRVRSDLNLRLLVYTDSLQKRKQIGSHGIQRHDVIITTFDILKAKEICIAEEGCSNDENNDAGWISNAAPTDLKNELSQLHLINWKWVVVDSTNMTNLKRGNVKGKAISMLKSQYKLCYFEDFFEDSSNKSRTQGKKAFRDEDDIDNFSDEEILGAAKFTGIGTPNDIHRNRTKYNENDVEKKLVQIKQRTKNNVKLRAKEIDYRMVSDISNCLNSNISFTDDVLDIRL